MPEHTKLATCSYCSARTMLVLSARDGHELACASCGAPLHEMKWLKSPSTASPTTPRARKRETGYIPGVHGPEHGPSRGLQKRRAAPSGYDKRRKKRKKPMWKRALSEAVDVIEDIFD